MRTMIFLLVLSLFLAGCGPTDSAIQTAIAETQEAQASTSPEPTRPIDQDTPAAETFPTIGADRPTGTPLPPTPEPTQPVESQEVQSQSDVPSLVLSAQAESFAIADGKIVIEAGDNQVRAFDLKTGESVWIANATGEILGADPELVYIKPSELRVDALDASTGEFMWRFLSEEPISPIAANENAVLFSGEPVESGTYLYTIDKSNGNLADSTFFAEEKISGWTSEGIMLVGGGKLGLLSDAGQLEWLISDVSDTDVESLWFCDGMLVAGGEDLNGLGAFNVNTGSPIWWSDFVQSPAQSPSDAEMLGLYSSMKASTTSSNYLWRYQLTWDVTWKFCGTNNIYVRGNNTIQAISKETGDLSWSGLVSNLVFLGGSYKDNTQWLGEVEGLVVYSHIGYGWTQAYSDIDHALLWENFEVVLKEVVGVSESVLIGVAWHPDQSQDSSRRIIVGLDEETGRELWRIEPGEIGHIGLLEGRLFYQLGRNPHLLFQPSRKSEITFLEPRSGETIAAIPFDRNTYFASIDGIIVAHNSEEVAVIRP